MTRAQPFKIDGIEVRASHGKGRGVFTTKTFKEGGIIEISPVIFLNLGDGAILSHTELGSYTFGMGSDGAEGTSLALGYASLYNHSCDPNCTYESNNSAMVITALQDLAVGTELTIDYGWYSTPEEYEESWKEEYT